MVERYEQQSRSLGQSVPAEPENIQTSAGRRRFLKGLGIGLPAVMTLRSGALMAATSSSQCLAHRQITDKPPAVPAFNTSDNWLRQSKSPYTAVEYTNGTNTVWIVTVNGSNYDATSGSAFDLSGYHATGNTKSNYLPLCYVDNSGNVVSCDPTTNPAELGVNNSCAASFLIQP